MRFLTFACTVAVTLVACNGADEKQTAINDVRTLLESAILKGEDLPPGLERVNASYNTNADGSEVIEVSLVPGPEAPPDLAIRGGLTHVVSFYTTVEGAEDRFLREVGRERTVDWMTHYKDQHDVLREEVSRHIGDQSVWFRITGLDERQNLLIDDQVIFRVREALVFVQIISLFDEGSARDVYVEEVAGWAKLAAERAATAVAAAADIQ